MVSLSCETEEDRGPAAVAWRERSLELDRVVVLPRSSSLPLLVVVLVEGLDDMGGSKDDDDDETGAVNGRAALSGSIPSPDNRSSIVGVVLIGIVLGAVVCSLLLLLLLLVIGSVGARNSWFV